jgi:chromate transporter
VHEFHWLNDQQFLDAVAVALITPGPVVITVAFIGYLVAGAAGATVAAIGIFLPVYLFTIVPAPWFKRHRNNLQLRAFAAGATAAASGAIAGAVLVLGRRAIVDGPTMMIAVVCLILMVRLRVTEPLVVAGSGLAGLLLAG